MLLSNLLFNKRITIKSLAYLSETFIYFYIGFAITDGVINKKETAI